MSSGPWHTPRSLRQRLGSGTALGQLGRPSQKSCRCRSARGVQAARYSGELVEQEHTPVESPHLVRHSRSTSTGGGSTQASACTAQSLIAVATAIRTKEQARSCESARVPLGSGRWFGRWIFTGGGGGVVHVRGLRSTLGFHGRCVGLAYGQRRLRPDRVVAASHGCRCPTIVRCFLGDLTLRHLTMLSGLRGACA